MDTLEAIFEMQEKLQNRPHIKQTEWIQQVRIMTLALMVETGEALQTLNWKPWRDRPEDKEKFKEELIDCMHFLVNLMLLSGMTVNEVYARYAEKNKINAGRMNK